MGNTLNADSPTVGLVAIGVGPNKGLFPSIIDANVFGSGSPEGLKAPSDATKWVMLAGERTPKSINSHCIKLSRHLDQGGRIWTLVAAYTHIAFAAESRGGHYAGVGLVVAERDIRGPLSDTLRILLAEMIRDLSSGGSLAKLVSKWRPSKEAYSAVERLRFEQVRGQPSGIGVGMENGLMKHISPWSSQELDDAINAAQTDNENASVSSTVLVNWTFPSDQSLFFDPLSAADGKRLAADVGREPEEYDHAPSRYRASTAPLPHNSPPAWTNSNIGEWPQLEHGAGHSGGGLLPVSVRHDRQYRGYETNQDPVKPHARHSGGSNVISIFAIVVALIALMLVSWTYINIDNKIDAVSNRMDIYEDKGADPTATSPAELKSHREEQMTDCSAISGDTIMCNNLKFKLFAVEAPALPEICSNIRNCFNSDALRSLDNLKNSFNDTLTIKIIRNIDNINFAIVKKGSVNLSCLQLSAGMVTYRSDWDDGNLIENECGL